MGTEQKDRLLKLYNDNYESHFKGANYLFVAHGTGFVGGLALVKDYAATPEFKGIGVFIVIFGLGLISGMFYYISLAFSRATAVNAVMDESEVNSVWQHFVTWINVPTLVISMLSLLGAIVALMCRFARL